MKTTRRDFLSFAGASATMIGLTGCEHEPTPAIRHGDAAIADVVSPHGPYQAGILTPAQQSVLVTAYDLADGGRAAMSGVLRRWSPAITAMSVADGEVPETTGLRAARLTATVGIGPDLPAKIGITPPPGLAVLPPLPGDRLQAERSGGDVCVQVCADDPTVAVQATAALTRLADGVLTPRWQQSGFRSPRPDGTVRNLFGFKDGSANPAAPETLAEALWITGPAAYAGGTHLVVRRIRMDTAAFARLPVAAQEAAIGRHKDSGAPLGGKAESETPNLFIKTDDGRYVIPVDAHIRRAHALAVGAPMLRRGYNYADSPDDQGLLFLAFQKSPDVFVRTQTRLAEQDALTRFTETRGSALFYMLPGMRPGEWLGQHMLGGR